MSDLTLVADAGIEGQSMLKINPQTRQAGVAIKAGQPTYIDSSGLFQLSVTTVNSPATGTFMRTAFDGVPASDIASGSYGEIYGQGAEVRIQDSGLTIGSVLWASNTAGKWANAKVATQDEPIAQVISATSVILLRGV